MIRRALLLAVLVGVGATCGEPGSGPPPLGGTVAGDGTPRTISGNVAQELSAGRYTYFLLKTADGAERWVVVADSSHRGARRLTVDSCRSRRDFVSRRLDRRFAVLDRVI
jgi:hypothetical protein